MPNPLVDDRTVSFLLYEVLDAERLCELPGPSEHTRETFDLYLQAARRLARDVLFPLYRSVDEIARRLENGRVIVHPALRDVYARLIELGTVNATEAARDLGLPEQREPEVHAQRRAVSSKRTVRTQAAGRLTQ